MPRANKLTKAGDNQNIGQQNRADGRSQARGKYGKTRVNEREYSVGVVKNYEHRPVRPMKHYDYNPGSLDKYYDEQAALEKQYALMNQYAIDSPEDSSLDNNYQNKSLLHDSKDDKFTIVNLSSDDEENDIKDDIKDDFGDTEKINKNTGGVGRGNVDQGPAPLADNGSIAPDNLKNRERDTTYDRKKPVPKEQSLLGRALTGAIATGGALAGAGAVLGTGLLPGVGTLSGGFVGLIVGGVVGGVAGFVAGLLAVGGHNKRTRIEVEQNRLEEQKTHFDQAVDNLREGGMKFGKTERQHLSAVTSEQWDRLMNLDNVQDEGDRLRIRQAVIAEIARTGNVGAAKALRAKIDDAHERNTLGLMLGARSLNDAPKGDVKTFIRDYAAVMGIEKLWTPEDDNDDNIIQSRDTNHQIGGCMMLGAMRRLQNPFYKLKLKDQRQINQALAPRVKNPEKVAIKDDQVGTYMTPEEKLALADRMQAAYRGNLEIGLQKSKSLGQDYKNAKTLNDKLAVLEDYVSASIEEKKGDVIGTLEDMALNTDLSHLPPGATRPSKPSEAKQKEQRFFDQIRGRTSIDVGKNHPSRAKLRKEISTLQDESPDPHLDLTRAERAGHADVSRFFLRDADRISITLKDGNGNINLKETFRQKRAGKENLKDWDAGDELLKFCDGDKTVARNLSRFAHQGVLKGMIDVLEDSVDRGDNQPSTPSFGESSSHASNKLSIQVDKDKDGNFTVTALDEKALNRVFLPGALRPRLLDPNHNRRSLVLKIKLTKENLKKGNGNFDFVGEPHIESRLDVDRGGFRHSNALYDAQALDGKDVQKHKKDIISFMDKHRRIMLTDTFWNSDVNGSKNAKLNQAVFGTGIALALVERVIREQDNIDDTTIEWLKKALNPVGDPGLKYGGVRDDQFDPLLRHKTNDKAIRLMADLIFQQYAPPRQEKGGGLGGKVEMNMDGQARNDLHDVFDNPDSTGAERLEALNAALDHRLTEAATDIDSALKTIFENWEDPRPEAV